MLLIVLALAGPVHAIQTCELAGEHVNPANGHTTAGKTGLMRCKDADTGVIQREQELRDGKFLGAVRFYRNGVLEREHRVNERGNRESLAREYAATHGERRWTPGEGGAELRGEKRWYLNGQPSEASEYTNDNGQLRAERHHDERGRVTRERELDEAGQVTRDDAVFEDGSRNAFSR